MPQKICPICDHVMKYPHYCRNCKSWVKGREVQSAAYYLNESHPKEEKQCSYHGIEGRGQGRNFTEGGRQAQAAAADTKTAGWVSRDTSVPPVFDEAAGTGREPRREPKGILWVFATMAVVVTAAFFVKSFVGAARKRAVSDLYAHLEQAEDSAEMYEEDEWEYEDGWGYEDEWGYGDEWGYEDEWGYGDEWEYGDYGDFEEDPYYKYVEDEDVIAAGIACNELGHFNISQSEMKERASHVLDKHGYNTAQTRQDSYNVETLDYDGNTVSSEYSTYFRYILGEADGWWGDKEYVELDYDTATGKLHGIELMVRDEDELVSLSVELLEQLEEGSGLPEGMWSVSVKRNMPGVLNIGDGYRLIAGNVSIWGYCFEDEYYFYISLWGDAKGDGELLSNWELEEKTTLS